jgi:hypothetical protein
MKGSKTLKNLTQLLARVKKAIFVYFMDEDSYSKKAIRYRYKMLFHADPDPK